eukprot:9377033-Alexandrium_andersonii.AAC.1
MPSPEKSPLSMQGLSATKSSLPTMRLSSSMYMLMNLDTDTSMFFIWAQLHERASSNTLEQT